MGKTTYQRNFYQYESRHIHAVKRARGPKGQFLSKDETVKK
jgi:hypothetical protein